MVTSYDVAREAGVSQSTVSRALADNHRISLETRTLVRETAERLGFTPSHHGRQLATRRTHRIGVLATELDNPFYMALLDPLHESLREAGYRTTLLTDPAHTPIGFDELADGSIDGLILTTCRLNSTLPAALNRRGVPSVTLNRAVEPAVVDSCVVANSRGAALVAQQLLAAGHRRIAHIAGPSNTSTGRDRAAGFRRALASAGAPLDRSLLIRGEFTYEAGHAAMLDLASRDRPPTAVFCANDVLALGAVNAARGLGLRVPGDVSVVGFDDIPMASWEVLSLSTVRCDLRRLAVTAAELLLSRLGNPALPLRAVTLEPQFVPRSSLGPVG